MLKGKVNKRKVKTKSVQMVFNVMHGGIVACNIRKKMTWRKKLHQNQDVENSFKK